jgi:tetratricopeptide (TPR) repeat protein
MFLMAQSSKNFDYYYYKGLVWSDSASAKSAVALLDTALSLKPKDPDTYVARGKAKVGAHLYKDAFKDFDWAIANAKKNEKIKYLEKKEDELSGSGFITSLVFGQQVPPYKPTIAVGKRKEFFLEADVLGIFNDEISSYPDSPSVFIDRAGYYYRLGKYSDAISDLKKAVEVGQSPYYYYLLASVMNASKNYSDKKIAKVFEDGVNKNYTDGWAYYYRAKFNESQALSYRKLYDSTKDANDKSDAKNYYTKTLADFDQAIELKRNPSWYNDTISFRIKTSKYTDEEILNYYAKMLLYSNYDNKNDSYFARSSYYSSTNRYKEAIADLDSSLHFRRDYLEAYLLRADLKDKAGTYSADEIGLDLDNAKPIKEKPAYLPYKEIYDRLFSKYGKQ